MKKNLNPIYLTELKTPNQLSRKSLKKLAQRIADKQAVTSVNDPRFYRQKGMLARLNWDYGATGKGAKNASGKFLYAPENIEDLMDLAPEAAYKIIMKRRLDPAFREYLLSHPEIEPIVAAVEKAKGNLRLPSGMLPS